MTNGDRIRSMTDKELVNFLLSREIRPCAHCQDNGFLKCWKDFICTQEHECFVLKRWLSSEARLLPEPDPAEDKKN